MGRLHLFTLADIPVRISLWYVFLLVYLVRGSATTRGALLAALGVTLSLLAHEFGHAFVARHYGLHPEIMLHGLGGETGHQRARSDRQEALIVAAGPLAGLLLGAACLGLVYFGAIDSAQAQQLFTQMAFLNIFWSAFNLLPLWPMDGGHLMRIGASKLFGPVRGRQITHVLSVAVIIALAAAGHFVEVGGYALRGTFMLLLLAMMAWQNVQALSRREPEAVQDNPVARELLMRAEAAYQAGDDDEAARLSHQLRSQAHVPDRLLARSWAILGVTATRKGNYREALSYLRRAPDLPDVVEATAQCLYQLEMYDALEALVSTHAFARLPSQTRELILGALRDSLTTCRSTS